METRLPEKRLQVGPFAVQATRGVLRDPRVRRKTMAILLVTALILIALGVTGGKAWFEPHEHPARFILFWFACGWITLTALLLALLDLLVVRTEARRARKALRAEVDTSSDANGQP